MDIDKIFEDWDEEEEFNNNEVNFLGNSRINGYPIIYFSKKSKY